MKFVDILTGVNYGLAFFFSSYLILSLVNDRETDKKWTVFFAVYWPVCLALQTIS